MTPSYPLPALLLALWPGAAAPGPQATAPSIEETREVTTAAFETEVIFEVDHKLSGCVAADFDPRYPGDEIVVIGEKSVYLVWRADGSWKSAKIARTAGEVIQCAAGDADPTSPGDELLVFGALEGTENDGGSGVAYLAKVEVGHLSKLQPVVTDRALLHGGAIVDIDPASPGAELVLAGFSNRVRVARRQGSRWKVETACKLPGAGKAVVGTDTGVVIACTDGSLIELTRSPAVTGAEASWRTRTIDHAGAGQSRLGFADGRVIAARDDGVLALVSPGAELDPSGTSHRTEIHHESEKLRGAVLAELDPSSPGLEAATGGYGKTVTIFRQQDGAWVAERAFEDTGRLHHLAAGELAADRPGLELISCGYSGRLVLIK